MSWNKSDIYGPKCRPKGNPWLEPASYEALVLVLNLDKNWIVAFFIQNTLPIIPAGACNVFLGVDKGFYGLLSLRVATEGQQMISLLWLYRQL